MIGRIASLTADQRRLALSIVFNVATRLPGIVGVLLFLPLIKLALGVQGFSIMMAALALGGSIGFFTGGFGVIGRRLIGEAHGANDFQAEADAIRSLFDIAVMSFALMLAFVVGYGLISGAGRVFYIVPIFMSLVALLLQFDNIRASYNEQYITAGALIAAQTVTYTVAFLMPPASFSPIIGAFIIQVPQAAASIWTGVTLLMKRPYLLQGRSVVKGPIFYQGLLLGLGDGLMMASLGFALVFLQATGRASDAAWFAATTRVFMIVLAPMLLLLLPISSYVRIMWRRASPEWQNRVIRLSFIGSLTYSVVVGFGLYLTSGLYVEGVLKILQPRGMFITLPIFTMFSAILAFKSYTAISIVVLDSQRFSREIAVVIVLVLTVSGLASFVFNAINTVAIFSGLLSFAVIALILYDVYRFKTHELPVRLQ